MLNELECAWLALFGECIVPELRHNEHILNSSIASEFSSLDRDDSISKPEEAKLYSLKKVLQVILDNPDTELTEVGVEAVFKAREELVNLFKNVAQSEGFSETLKDAIKLVIVDALNRKVKERNPDYTIPDVDVSNVNAAKGYFEKSADIKDILREIKKVDHYINATQMEIQQMKSNLQTVNGYITALQDKEGS